MVDYVLAMDDVQVETSFYIKEDNIFVSGNVFIETGLIENAAQTCSSIAAKDYFTDIDDPASASVVGFISSVKTLKLYAMPKVGETIITRALCLSKFVSDEYSLCTMQFTTLHNEVLLLEGEINLYIQEHMKSKEAAAPAS